MASNGSECAARGHGSACLGRIVPDVIYSPRLRLIAIRVPLGTSGTSPAIYRWVVCWATDIQFREGRLMSTYRVFSVVSPGQITADQIALNVPSNGGGKCGRQICHG